MEELLDEDNPVRVIDTFVESLNMGELKIQHAEPASTGRPPYHPKDLLKLYIYGYFNRIRSSRRLMTECGRNIELFYLLNRLVPDFRTIADFRKTAPNSGPSTAVRKCITKKF
jgi:transposase